MTAANVRPTVLTVGMSANALTDGKFFMQVPEFLPMKQKVSQMKVQLTGRGCSGCKKRRIQKNLFSDFLTIVRALSPDGLSRLKDYFGAQALMLQWRDPRTKQHQVEIL